MGCFSSPELIDDEKKNISLDYMLELYDLEPSERNKNTYILKLLKSKKLQRVSKTLGFQLKNNSDEFISKIFQEKNNADKSLFYVYLRERPVIKPYQKIRTLKTIQYERLRKIAIILANKPSEIGVNRQMIKKLIPNIEDLDFNKKTPISFDFTQQLQTQEKVDNPNLTEDSISLSDDEQENEDKNQDDDEEEIEEYEEKDNEIVIDGDITEEDLKEIKIKLKNSTKDKSTYIKKFVIRNCQFGDDDNSCELLNEFLEDLFEYQYLKKFIFTNNITNDEFKCWENIFNLIKANSGIRILNFAASCLSDNILSYLCKVLRNKRIRVLDLRENYLTKNSAEELSKFLKKNKTLQRLYLQSNAVYSFKAEGVRMIMESLRESVNINILDFSFMDLTLCGKHIADFLKVNNSLKELSLHGCKLNLMDFRELCKAIAENKILESLDIGMNDMGGDQSLKEVANMIRKNKKLTSLNLDKMNINMENYEIIFDAIKENSTITKYYFSYNSDLKPIIVLKFFFQLKCLKFLEFVPYDPDNDKDKGKELTLDEKKFIEKYKNERTDIELKLK